jgi:pimeloyl-ACP methyl ester carboxylesterase
VSDNTLEGGEGTDLGDALQFGDDVIVFDPARAIEFFYHDCTPEIAAAAAARLAPMSLAAMSAMPRAIAWKSTPSTFVVCTDDRILPVALQQSSAARTGNVVEIGASHSPFLSRPDDVASLLIELSRA